MNLTPVLDHTALYRADPVFTGLYVVASRGTGRVLIPSLSVLAAERRLTGAGRHAASLRFAESVPFTGEHARDAMDWGKVELPVAHAAAIAWHAVKAGEPLTVLPLEPRWYSGTGITPLNPTWPHAQPEAARGTCWRTLARREAHPGPGLGSRKQPQKTAAVLARREGGHSPWDSPA